jgi:hypothetical protein
MVCTAEDAFTKDWYWRKPRWEAVLSDGTTVIQDDGRPGLEPSAWLRLARHCWENGLRVRSLSVRFRSNVVRAVPDDAPGYFFRNCVKKWLSGHTVRSLLVGWLGEGGVRVTRLRVPDLVVLGEEVRDPADDRAVGFSLLINSP